MSPKGSVEVDVKCQAKVRKDPKPPEFKEPKYYFWDRPKVTRDPRIIRRLQQGDLSLPLPTFHPPKPARDNFDPPPAYYPPEPARPSHGLSDKGQSRHNDKALRRAQTTHRQQRYKGISNYSQREIERVNHGHSDQGRSRHDDRSQRGSERDSQRGDQHGSQRSN